MVRLVVTRPLPDGEKTAALLRARGHEVLLAPLMHVEPVNADLSGAWVGIIMTSANAASAMTDELKRVPVFTVGARTADAAREHGFANVISADGDARDLVGLIAGRAPSGPLLYLSGEHRAHDLEAELSQHGIAVTTRIVYRAGALGFSTALVAALREGTVDGVLHYSRRSAAAYLDGATAANMMAQALRPRHFCLSDQIAAALRVAGARHIDVAERPNEEAIVDIIFKHAG